MTPAQRAKKEAKKRRQAEYMTSALCVFGFLIFGLLIAIFLLVVPRSKTSNIEKRALATWPEFSFSSYFSGDYTAGIMQFYDDTVPARDTFKNAGNNFKSAYGIHPKGSGQLIGNVAKVEETTAPEETAPAEGETPAETTVPETTEDINSMDFRHQDAEATMSDGILLVHQQGHWRALALFGGGDGQDYVDAVNYVRENVSSKVNIYVMPVPLASQFYLPANYADYSTDQKAWFEGIYKRLDSGVTPVDIIETLNNHNEEDIYLRTDHHWSALGAYYACREFAKVANVPFVELSDKDYETKVNEGYMGTMYAFTESADLLNDPEDFVWYESKNKYICDYYDTYFNYYHTDNVFRITDTANSYLTFLGGDGDISKVTTDVKNGRKLFIIKDSYGNAEVPFFLNSFEEIYVADMRYFDLNICSFVETLGITDVLFSCDAYSFNGDIAYSMLLSAMYNTEIPIVDDAPPAVLPGEEPSTTTESTKAQEETAADEAAEGEEDTEAEGGAEDET